MNRVGYIDKARGLAIFLVVLGHTISGPVNRILYSFHMPLFFMISGMLLRIRNENDQVTFVDVIKKRSFTYMLPYVVWGLLYSQLNLINIFKLLYGTREYLLEIGSLSSLWFLPVLFIADIAAEGLMYVVRFIKAEIYQKVVLGLVMLASFTVGFLMPHIKPYGWFWGLDIGFVALGFMLLGFLARKFFDYVNKNKYYVPLACAVGNLILIMVIQHYWLPVQKVAMHKGNYGDVFTFLVNAILESTSIIFIAISFDKLKMKRDFLSFIGINTMSILLLHRPMVKSIGEKIGSMGYSLDSIIVALPIAMFGLIISLAIGKFIEIILPEIVGKNRRGNI